MPARIKAAAGRIFTQRQVRADLIAAGHKKQFVAVRYSPAKRASVAALGSSYGDTNDTKSMARDIGMIPNGPMVALAKAEIVRRIQMRKISLFGVAAVVIATGLGAWAASSTNARVAPPMGHGIEPFQLMMNANELPTVEFADYTFVFVEQPAVSHPPKHGAMLTR
jgi:hypothetical protein